MCNDNFGQQIKHFHKLFVIYLEARNIYFTSTGGMEVVGGCTLLFVYINIWRHTFKHKALNNLELSSGLLLPSVQNASANCLHF